MLPGRRENSLTYIGATVTSMPTLRMTLRLLQPHSPSFSPGRCCSFRYSSMAKVNFCCCASIERAKKVHAPLASLLPETWTSGKLSSRVDMASSDDSLSWVEFSPNSPRRKRETERLVMWKQRFPDASIPASLRLSCAAGVPFTQKYVVELCPGFIITPLLKSYAMFRSPEEIPLSATLSRIASRRISASHIGSNRLGTSSDPGHHPGDPGAA
mmetsp:Transcript_40294/g.95746  ORF Transcript_40294/g.95746 Transcript_40294/m.95746 type:complete len:213 (+) Transcript_40294:109-747(+)